METWSLPITFAILLFGVFVIRKLWLGALLAILFFLTAKFALTADVGFAYAPAWSALVISQELGLLLFGAYLFFSTLADHRHFDGLIQVTSSFSSRLFILIILCVFMGSFMEGIAGFGIPAMLIAPLLVTLGYRPLTCIVLPLATNTTAVTFGALGTPLKVGFGILHPDATVAYTLLLNALPALTLPLLLAYLYGKTEQTKVDWQTNWKMLLGAGLIFSLLYVSMGLVSVEFPAVVAGFLGLVLFVSFFVPKAERPSQVFWLKTFYPYFLFIFLLLSAKFLLSGYTWRLTESTRALSFYQPGLIFILSSWIYLKLNSHSGNFTRLSHSTLNKTGKSILTILLLVVLVQLLQGDLSALVERYYVVLQPGTKELLNPLLGILGSFISGSATMSNLMFGSAIASDALLADQLPYLLALLHTGSAIGNSISLQNIIMVKSVVNQAGIGFPQVLKLNSLAVGLYLILVLVLVLWIGS